MNLKTLLCMLLSTVCNSVTAVESSPAHVTLPGEQKKAEAMKGVAQFLDGLAAGGPAFDRPLVEQVAGGMIDGTVQAAHAIGAFEHHAPTPAEDGGAKE